MDFYDSLFLGVAEIERMKSEMSLFVTPTDDRERSNIQYPGIVSREQTAVVINWYARTSLPPSPALDAFTNTTIITLVIGSRPYRQTALYNLLRRAQDQPLDFSNYPDQAELEREAQLQKIAAEIFREDHLSSAFPTPESMDWDQIPVASKDRFIRMARAAMRAMTTTKPPVLIIPMRQSYSALVHCGDLDALRDACKRFVGPDAIPGQPGMWLHLEGVMVRDVT